MLKRILVVVLFAILPTLVQAQNYPVYSSDSPPTEGAACNNYGGVIISKATGTHFYCGTDGKWHTRAPTTGGDMQQATYDTDHDATVETADEAQHAVSADVSADSTTAVMLKTQSALSIDASEMFLSASLGLHLEGILEARSGVATPFLRLHHDTSTPTLRVMYVALDADGLADDPVVFVDADDNGQWDGRFEPLLVSPGSLEVDAEDCGGMEIPNQHAMVRSSFTPSTLARAMPYQAAHPTEWGPNRAYTYCRARTDEASGDTWSSVVVASPGHTGTAIAGVNRLLYFGARVGSDTDNDYSGAKHGGRVFVGGILADTAYDLSAINSMVAFVCDPAGDPDGDGTPHDGAEDKDWWAVVADGISGGCRQFQDGDSDGKLDCDVDGTADHVAADVELAGYDTGIPCVHSYTYYQWLEIQRESDTFRFTVRDYDGTETVIRHDGAVPEAVSVWGVNVWDNDTADGYRAEEWVDVVRYIGLP